MSGGAGSDTNAEPVTLEVSDEIATLTLNRPEQFNAINVSLAHALTGCLVKIAASPAEVVVLTAAGRGFCGGGDVAAMAAAASQADYLDELVEAAHIAMNALHTLPQPVVARIHGAAAGAGIGLALAADIAIASEHAKFTPAYGAIGLSPDCGGSAQISAAIGDRRARTFFLLGRRATRSRLPTGGSCRWRCQPMQLDTAVGEAVAAIRSQGPHAPRATKHLLGVSGSYTERLAEERHLIVENARTAFARERIAAFTAS